VKSPERMGRLRHHPGTLARMGETDPAAAVQPQQLLTVREVRQLLRCGEALARALVREAGPIRLGRRTLRVRPEDLARVLASREVATTG
jgi:hypothetical protein